MDPEAVKDYLLEKLKGFWFLSWNFGELVIAKIDEIFPPETRKEKLKEFWLLLWNFGELVIAKIDEIFPPETREEKFRQWFKTALPYLIIATLLLLLCRRGGSSSGRTMKAPGRNYRISRDRFQSDPKSYFRDLHGK